MAAPKGADTRNRILNIAQSAVLQKGFDATSIEEIVAEVAISKAGFFYHFPDKNALARALIERYIIEEEQIFDGLEARANQLADDPLQRLLIELRLLAELLGDMPKGHPGCIIATAAYQDRLFDARVRALNRTATLGWRKRFRRKLDLVVAAHPPRDALDLDALADYFNTVVEGGIIMSKALGEPHMIVGQILLLRNHIGLLFAPARS